jgi:long-chain acyl-CoA synthetase
VNVEIADPAVTSTVILFPPEEVTEIVIRGHNIMNGYHNRSEDTEAAIVDGWFRSGDLGRKSRAAAVYGIPHPINGEEVVASVVLRAESSASEEELIGFVKSEVASYKYPRHIRIVPSLPLGPSGKVLKRDLAQAWRS